MKEQRNSSAPLFLILPDEGTTTPITSDGIRALSPSWEGDGKEYLFFGFT